MQENSFYQQNLQVFGRKKRIDAWFGVSQAFSPAKDDSRKFHDREICEIIAGRKQHLKEKMVENR